MPPFLYPLNHQQQPQPKTKKYLIDENNQECIPMKPLKNYNPIIHYIRRRRSILHVDNGVPIVTTEFYIPDNEYLTSYLSKTLVEGEKEKKLIVKKKKNKRDEFVFV